MSDNLMEHMLLQSTLINWNIINYDASTWDVATWFVHISYILDWAYAMVVSYNAGLISIMGYDMLGNWYSYGFASLIVIVTLGLFIPPVVTSMMMILYDSILHRHNFYYSSVPRVIMEGVLWIAIPCFMWGYGYYENNSDPVVMAEHPELTRRNYWGYDAWWWWPYYDDDDYDYWYGWYDDEVVE